MPLPNLEHNHDDGVSTSILKPLCSLYNVKTESIRQMCFDLGIQISLKKTATGNEEIDVVLPPLLLHGNYTDRGRLIEEIKSYKPQFIKCLSEDGERLGRDNNREFQEHFIIESWKKSFNALLTMPKPHAFDSEVWDKLKVWISMFMDEATPHLSNLVQYSWTHKDIFGCHEIEPQDKNFQDDFLKDGFLSVVISPFDNGQTLHEVLKDRIVVVTKSGQLRNYFMSSGS